MYKKVDISAETRNKAEVSVIKIQKNDNVNRTLLKLLCISDIEKRQGGKNIYALIDKVIKGKYMVKNMRDLTKPQIRKDKTDRARLFRGNWHSMYVDEDITITIIMQSRLSDPKKSNLELNQYSIKSI